MPDGLPPLREVIAKTNLSARKSLGQNFILDLNLTRRIARSTGPLEGRQIIEVGPGPGGLTRALLMEGASRVVVIERDKRCLPALEEISAYYPERLEIIEGDALKLNYTAFANASSGIIANLPYGIATELLIGWLKTEPWPPWFDSLALMFQKEVAERIVALPGSRSYGRLSILSQWRTSARIAFSLPARAFTPPPKIDSALVVFTPRQTTEDAGSLEALEKVTAAAFGQRRKMLRSSLKGVLADTDAVLARINIDPTLRAEQLTIAQFCTLARLCHTG